MQNTAIKLTNDEWEVLKNTSFFVHKHSIFAKFAQSFHHLNDLMRNEIIVGQQQIDKYFAGKTGKLTRGENYQLLPYMVFDYPRIAGIDSVFTLRSMLWWGKFFSFNLIISGKAFDEFRGQLSFKPMNRQLRINTGENLWNHDMDSEGYADFNKEIFEEQLKSGSFIRLARKMPLENWENLEKESIGAYLEMLGLFK